MAQKVNCSIIRGQNEADELGVMGATTGHLTDLIGFSASQRGLVNTGLMGIPFKWP